jgi:trigger factor
MPISEASSASPHLARVKVDPPDIEGIVVRLSAIEPPTAEELAERLEDLRLLHAQRRVKSAGERVAWGDEVTLDLVARADGKLLPFGAQPGLQLVLREHDGAARWSDGLVGLPIGQPSRFAALLGADYPAPALRGRPASFEVTLFKCAAVTLPAADDSAFLAALGFGTSLDATLQAISGQLAEERLAKLRLQATERALEELVTRSRATVDDGVIDLEIGLAWRSGEGILLGASAPEERDESLRAWLEDPEMRQQARARVLSTLVVRAIAERDGLRQTREAALRELEVLAKVMDLPVTDLASQLQADAALEARALEQLTHLRTVAHVMERVTVRIGTP